MGRATLAILLVLMQAEARAQTESRRPDGSGSLMKALRAKAATTTTESSDEGGSSLVKALRAKAAATAKKKAAAKKAQRAAKDETARAATAPKAPDAGTANAVAQRAVDAGIPNTLAQRGVDAGTPTAFAPYAFAQRGVDAGTPSGLVKKPNVWVRPAIALTGAPDGGSPQSSPRTAVTTVTPSTPPAVVPAKPRPAQDAMGFPWSERAADVPPSEKLKRTDEAIARMRNVLKEVLAKLEEARTTKDVVKLNCVNLKVTHVKGLLRISEQANLSLQEAVAKKESSSADHEYTKVSIARQKVNQLRGEAEECIGQLAFRTDKNLLLEVDVPSDLPSLDPTLSQPLPDVVAQLPMASPTL